MERSDAAARGGRGPARAAEEIPGAGGVEEEKAWSESSESKKQKKRKKKKKAFKVKGKKD